jgi:suppressor for copper-sensitivity B
MINTKIFVILCVLITLVLFPLKNAEATLISEWQDNPHSKLRLMSPGLENAEGFLVLDMEIEDGWSIYWRYPGELGLPTSIEVKSDALLHQEVLWPYPASSVVTIAQQKLESYLYQKRIFFPMHVVVDAKAKTTNFEVKISYGICKDICIPVETTLVLEMSVGEKNAEVLQYLEKALQKIPVKNGSNALKLKHENTRWKVHGETGVLYITATNQHPFKKQPSLFIEGDESVIFLSPVVNALQEKEVQFDIPFKLLNKTVAISDKTYVVTLVYQGDAIEETIGLKTKNLIYSEEEAMSVTIIIGALLGALISGVLLNFMPGVLPVLFLNVLEMIEKKQFSNKDVVQKNLFSFATGILVAFLMMGVMLVVLSALGVTVEWGLHMQQPYFNIIMILMLVFFMCHLLQMLHITLPDRWQQKIILKIPHEEFSDYFFSGVVAALFSTLFFLVFFSGEIGGYLLENKLMILLTFILIGTGMALPYVLFALYSNVLPPIRRSQNWIKWGRRVLAVPIIVTLVWLNGNVSEQLGDIGARILLILMLVIIISLIPGFWKNGLQRAAMVIVAIVAALSLPQQFSIAKDDSAATSLLDSLQDTPDLINKNE